MNGTEIALHEKSVEVRPMTRVITSVLALLALSPTAHAVPITVSPTTSGSALADYGDGLFDELWPTPDIFVAHDGFTNRRASFEFDLGGLPDGMVVATGQIGLQLVSTSLHGTSTPPGFQLFGYAGDGVTGLADFTGGVLLGSLPAGWGNLGTVATFDVGSFLQGLVDSSASHAGFYIRLTLEDPATPFPFVFQSMQFVFPFGGGLKLDLEEAPPGPEPVPVPEPGPVSLLLAGLGVLAWMRRRAAGRVKRV